MKKKVLKIVTMILAVPLCVGLGFVLWMFGIAVYTDCTSEPDWSSTKLETLTADQTALLAEEFGLLPDAVETGSAYCYIDDYRSSDSLYFVAKADDTAVEALKLAYPDDLYAAILEKPTAQAFRDGTKYTCDQWFHYCRDTEGRVYTIYRLSDGSGYVFYIHNPPEELRFPGEEKEGNDSLLFEFGFRKGETP